MLGTCLADSVEARKCRHQNFIDNPHIVAHYVHLRHTMFQDEFFKIFHKATYYWCRYECQYHWSLHVHGLLWLKHVVNMEILKWDDPTQVRIAK